jgi:hypothetical protein
VIMSRSRCAGPGTAGVFTAVRGMWNIYYLPGQPGAQAGYRYFRLPCGQSMPLGFLVRCGLFKVAGLPKEARYMPAAFCLPCAVDVEPAAGKRWGRSPRRSGTREGPGRIG